MRAFFTVATHTLLSLVFAAAAGASIYVLVYIPPSSRGVIFAGMAAISMAISYMYARTASTLEVERLREKKRAAGMVKSRGEGKMIDVLRMRFDKAEYLKMTQEERGLYLLLGHASNQVNVLWKLVTAATNRNPTDPVDGRVSGAQTQILARLTVGVLWEAWRLIEAHLLSSPLGKDVVPALDPQARAALESLKKRFGTSGMIAAVRNSYAFHHPTPEEIEGAFQAAVAAGDDPENWSTYLSTTLLNCFFFASDFVMAHGIMLAVKETDVIRAHKKLLFELGPIGNELSEVTYGYAAVMFRKYVGDEMILDVVAKLGDAPNIDDVLIPYFIETGDSKALPR
jgi:hypothetical protein